MRHPQSDGGGAEGLSLTIVPPELDLSVVGPRHNERQGGVEGRPVDPAVVALEDVLDHGIATAKHVRVHLAEGGFGE